MNTKSLFKNPRGLRWRTRLVAAGLLIGLASHGLAAVRTWTGGGAPDVNWSNPANWDGGVSTPAAGDYLVFDGTAGLNNNNDLTAGLSFSSITFATNAGAFVINGNTVKIGLWPNQPEHQGRIQSLPSWHNLGRKCEMRLFLRWYLWEHKTKAQWFGLRRWVYYKALHWAVNAHSPFACGVVPEKGSGGYSHWHCDQRKLHRGPHRYRNYIWPGPGSGIGASCRLQVSSWAAPCG